MQATQTRTPHIDSPTETAVARAAEQVGQGDLVALGEKLARDDAAGAEQFLGHLIWYSLAETRITREELIGALEDAGIDEELAPKKISPRDAFRRATASMEVVKVPITLSDQKRLIDDPDDQDDAAATGHANIMVRDVASNSDHIVRQVVREEVDSNNVRLAYEPVAQIQMNASDELSAFALAGKERDLLPAERKLLRDVWSRYDYECNHYDSAAIRRIISEIKKEGSPVSMKSSGGVYFISREHEVVTDSIVRLIAELKGHSTTSKSSMVMAVPLVDADEYRQALAESLDEQVERQARSLIGEMSKVLKSDSKITDKRQKEFVGRVRELSGTVKEYEELLEREVQGARSNLELAHREAMSLLSKVEVK